MYTFNEARSAFARARDKDKGYVLPGRLGQTRLVKTTKGYGIKYCQTVVVEILPDNTYVLNTGGYLTHTTKERINRYSSVYLVQRNFVWYLGYDKGAVPFFDGMRVNAKGKVLNAPKSQSTKHHDKLLSDIDAYATGYVEAVASNAVPKPSGGDCWGCCMVDADTGKGDVLGHDHLVSHLEEKYYVPSLLVNALREARYNPQYNNPWGARLFSSSLGTYKRAIKAYLRKRLLKLTSTRKAA